MARRDLLAEAQVTAAAEYAPQVAALGEALRQARRDRNAAIRTAAAANTGIARSLKEARGRVKSAYTGAQRLAAPPQAYQSDAYRSAAAGEQHMGTTALASSLANALKENSDRRIEAAAGRAYAVSKANAEYSGTAADLRTKRSELARQQGLATGATLSKLTEAQADRDLQVNLQNDRQAFDASESAKQRSFQHHEDALGRRNDRITAGIGAQADLDKLAAQQKFTAGQNAKDRKNARILAGMRSGGSGGGPQPTASTVYGGREKIQALTDIYSRVQNGAVSPEKGVTLKSMTDVHRYAQSKGYPEAVILAASNLATPGKGYIAPREIQALRGLGITVPKEWTPVQVKPHTRKRRRK